MVSIAKAIGVFLACIAIGCAFNPIPSATYPVARYSVQTWTSGLARRQFDSIAFLTGSTRTEQAACVSHYRVIRSESGTVVKIDRVVSAAEHWADSLNIYVRYPGNKLCGSATPVLHTHVVDNEMWGQPSPLDEGTAERDHATAPFHLVLSVRDFRAAKLTVYGLR